MRNRINGIVISCLLLAACDQSDRPKIQPLSEPTLLDGARAPLVNGKVGSPDQPLPAQVSYGRDTLPRLARNITQGQGGTITLDFAETDIRDVVAQILGGILHVNYTIDPAVTGAVTLHTAAPLLPTEVLPTLQMLLAEVGATLSRTDNLYRVLPSGGKATTGGGSGGVAGLADDAALAGSSMVSLRYAGAEDLAKALQPFLQSGGRVTPVAGVNALLVSGDPVTRDTILSLVHAFDVDILAGQSYALIPVASGGAKDAATALQEALHGRGGALSQEVRVIPMARVDAVLVVAASTRYIDDARRLFDLIERTRRTTMRNWHVYYLQNTNANDAAYVLQQAFTPDDVTAQPTQPPQPNIPGAGGQLPGQGGGGLMGGGLTAGGLATGQGTGGGGLMGGGMGASSLLGQPQQPATGTGQAANQNPLLGGLDTSAGGGGGRQHGMRIIPSQQHNALLIYGTDQENDTVEDMLRKIDILPMQVRIDAVIAEVQLNDALRYGTQFFFKSGGINGVLSGNSQTITTGTLATAAFSHTLPGFIIGGASGGGAPFAIDALQNVTKVQVLSSPQIMVLDNQPARLQVGQLVPIQTGSQSSTIGTSIYNQFTYQPTGVIMQVTPRVNNGGLVTLDISQEVSSVNATSSSTINPTFNDRSVTSRVVIQDGQTVGLAGLITDNSSRNNSGVPWFKDIPVLGFLAGNQSNNHQRTELLVLITPHVLHDQRDAQALTEDMRETLTTAAAVPADLARMHSSGSADPQARIRRGVGLGP
ncbi:type II secretion system secretin GspD [Komagataeibacter sp. FNDCR2]|uniref:type II secretion system secretin GspD n=1 Tax=Komagataeibacter sp. FNDCR2 TaxID=2878682 RepID=UPI001E4B10C2|nr:type II secretion system secretin GspD [Komagataeibacter sp. FNDCR2]MCE2574234.1 type II secretion system secretin GspD [Komagataeibacter sp. FNDCR2]